MNKKQYKEIYKQINDNLIDYGYGEFKIVNIEYYPKGQFYSDVIDVTIIQNVDTEIKIMFNIYDFGVDFDFSLNDFVHMFSKEFNNE